MNHEGNDADGGSVEGTSDGVKTLAFIIFTLLLAAFLPLWFRAILVTAEWSWELIP